MVRSVKRDSEIKHIAIVALVDARDAAGLDFSVGLEDFIVKSDSFEELETRIKFVLWRLSKVDSKDTVKAGALVMNLASYQVSVSGQQIELTYKEYELLRFLLRIVDAFFRATRCCAMSGAKSIWAARAPSMCTFVVCAPRSGRSSTS
jgi:two-component system alkaline phosphatase synthesis response regulator PhoP